MTPSKPPLVEVTWQDACSAEGWMSLHEALDVGIMECVSVGYIIDKDNEEYVTIAQSIDSQGNVADVTCIPTMMIEEMREL